ncbi:MAG: DUF4349 domain-containing protein [Euzebyaceae bacterium]|jgi:hypothetical protein|nr:DUF4349 domain-containing protein [Euzebyaceae bacterium]
MNRLPVAWLCLVLVLAAGCSGGGSSGGSAALEEQAAGGAEAGVAEEDRAQDSAAGSAADEVAEISGSGKVWQALPVASTGERVIKDGTIVLEIGEGTFDTAFAEVVRASDRLGGTVVATTTDNSVDGPPAGTVTVRVPADQYEQLLISMRDFGIVRNRRISSEDVSTEYVDLQSRLRQQEAQERFYLGLLTEARDVEDAIAIQQQLQGLQSDIERIKGRLQFIDDRTTFSTLTVELYEPGGIPVTEPPSGPSLAAAWLQAREAFVTVIGALLVTTVALLPLLLIAAAGWGAWRWSRRHPTTLSVHQE